MNLIADFYKIFYKIYFFFHPFELFKKSLKILSVSKEIFFNNISYYPKKVVLFEEKFANYIGCQYGLSFCNGTSSIDAALYALGVGNGDEVIVPSCTFHASIDPIVNLGATPIFVDVKGLGAIVDIDDLKMKISAKTKGVIIVHLFGNPSNVKEVLTITKEKQIFLLEDCSHAHGASFEGKRVGSFGDIACFSLQGAKAIAAGEGGIAVTDNKELLIRMSIYGHFERHKKLFALENKKYIHTGLGYKRRANPLGIAMALIDLSFINYQNKKMGKNYSIIRKILKKTSLISIPTELEPSAFRGGYYGGIPLLVDREKTSLLRVIKAFDRYGIAVSPYPFPLHHRLEQYVGTREKMNLPHTEYLKIHLILLDRRLLLLLPLATRFVLANIVKKLNQGR